ncbi:MAG TPA: exonuclease subunit SbcD [Abditibacteriaceae bacterium]|jgi:exonuclease SbcD
MKILHTGDWHMNDTLGRVDRSADICQSLEQIAHYLEEHAVDVMIVAGDLFSERSRLDQMRGAVGEIRRIFLPFLNRGGSILAISGNHDRDVFFEMLRDALDLVSPVEKSSDGFLPGGRLYISPTPRLMKLRDNSGQVVQFLLMPYPTPRYYLRDSDAQYNTVEEKNRAVQTQFKTALEQQKTRIDVTQPAVLISHIHVRGAQTHNLYRVTELEDVIFEPGDVPTSWAYVAYGHIHKPQSAVEGAPHVRYCGSVERLDFAERVDEKSVVLFEIGAEGLKGAPQILPLETSPILYFNIEDPEREIAELRTKYADDPQALKALVKYTLRWEPGKHNRDDLCRQLGAIFPRWYSRDLIEIGRDNLASVRTERSAHDVAGTVRSYLKTQFATLQPQQRDDLLQLGEELIMEVLGGTSPSNNPSPPAPLPVRFAGEGSINSDVSALIPSDEASELIPPAPAKRTGRGAGGEGE